MNAMVTAVHVTLFEVPCVSYMYMLRCYTCYICYTCYPLSTHRFLPILQRYCCVGSPGLPYGPNGKLR